MDAIKVAELVEFARFKRNLFEGTEWYQMHDKIYNRVVKYYLNKINMTGSEINSELITSNMPEGYGFTLVCNNIRGNVLCHYEIRRFGDIVENKRSDSVLWSLSEMADYFIKLKVGPEN